VGSCCCILTVPLLQLVESFRTDVTHIGKSIVIKGDVSGSGDVYWDGELEGSVELLDGSLTVGSGGCIRANLQARSIVVEGRVDGNLYGLERAELKLRKERGDLVSVKDVTRALIQSNAIIRAKLKYSDETSTPAEREAYDGRDQGYPANRNL
jgi:cytoskeletal protein CcmA (bactofilin family)